MRSYTRRLTSVFGVATTTPLSDVFPRMIGLGDGEVRAVRAGRREVGNVSDLPDCQSIVSHRQHFSGR